MTAVSSALPPLRDELRLLPAAANPDGSPAWLVQDPVSNRFYRIGWLDFELLLRWGMGSLQLIKDDIQAQTTLTVEDADVGGLLHFLQTHNLLKADSQQAVQRLTEQARQSRKSGHDWLIQHYLFFRVPLIRPQHYLNALHARLRVLFTPGSVWLLLMLCLLGVFLASRQWDAFAATFVDQLTWSGLTGYALALVVSKGLHEMGHALTATHHGVRVGHMGVAMVVLVPMLYTDTSESWKLKNPRQRLAIAGAGILTEFVLAGLATLAWSLAPEGSVKSACFFLATTSWILTLAINVSPFMRFDGYFILMDLLDMPNLHERSGALARAALRRWLPGLNEPWPEQLPGRGNALMIAFALATWLYRLVIFVGIALLVYHYFFKALGVVLFVLELAVFVVGPVIAELRVWHARRNEISRKRGTAWGLALAVLAVVALVPWQTSVHGAGWLHAARQLNVYSPLAGRLVSLPTEGKVSEGQTMFVLESPDAAMSAARASGLAQARAKELVGLSGLPDGEERRARLQLEREKLLAEANVYNRDLSRLQLIAPFGGALLDLDPVLAPNVWVQPRQLLAILIDPAQWVVEVFVTEAEVARIRAGDRARVQVHTAVPYYVNGKVTEVDASRTLTLPNPMLEARSGGAIATLTTSGNEAAPREALYRVKIALDELPSSMKAITCTAVINAEGRSLLLSLLERVVAIVIRESGF